jgi:hypothetical protein
MHEPILQYDRQLKETGILVLQTGKPEAEEEKTVEHMGSAFTRRPSKLKRSASWELQLLYTTFHDII